MVPRRPALTVRWPRQQIKQHLILPTIGVAFHRASLILKEMWRIHYSVFRALRLWFDVLVCFSAFCCTKIVSVGPVEDHIWSRRLMGAAATIGGAAGMSKSGSCLFYSKCTHFSTRANMFKVTCGIFKMSFQGVCSMCRFFGLHIVLSLTQSTAKELFWWVRYLEWHWVPRLFMHLGP